MDLASVFDLRGLTVSARPFPHAMHDGFIQPELYAELSRTFPDPAPSVSPSGYGLYADDAAYDRLLEQPAWRAFVEAARSRAFVDFVVGLFPEVLSESRVDLRRIELVDYVESRSDKERRHIADVRHPRDALWSRVDVHRGRRGYGRDVHLDHRRRLVTMLIYFCDAEEAQMLGGWLVLEPSATGLPPWRRKVVMPRHNRMVLFPCTPTSFHSVPPMLFASRDRRYVQVHLSSSVDLWTEPTEGPLVRAYRAARDSVPARVGRRVARDLALLRHRRKLASEAG